MFKSSQVDKNQIKPNRIDQINSNKLNWSSQAKILSWSYQVDKLIRLSWSDQIKQTKLINQNWSNQVDKINLIRSSSLDYVDPLRFEGF